jgi:hypothetical protein
MRNLPRFVSLSIIAVPAALMLSACGGDSATGSGTQTAGNSVPAIPSAPLPQAAAPDQGNGGAPGETPQADAPIQPSDYKPDPTYLPDDSHLGAVS